MLSQMDPSLVSFCDKIAAQGGPLQAIDDEDSSILQAAPVVQLVSVTRTSARLRNVQPEVDLSRSYEVLRRHKKSTENEHGNFLVPVCNLCINKYIELTFVSGTTTKESTARDERSPDDVDLSKPTSPEEAPKRPHSNGPLKEADKAPAEASPTPPGSSPEPMVTDNGENSAMPTSDDTLERLEAVKQRFMELTLGYGVPQLERLYSRIMKGAIELRAKETNEKNHRQLVVRHLLAFVENSDNF